MFDQDNFGIKDSLSRFIVRKSSYQVYSYFCQCPSNGISISSRLKEKVSAWGFCLEEFSILVKDTPDDQQWVVVHHIFSVERTDFARCAYCNVLISESDNVEYELWLKRVF